MGDPALPFTDRYFDLGRTTVSLFPAATATRNLSTQEVRFGVRYMID